MWCIITIWGSQVFAPTVLRTGPIEVFDETLWGDAMWPFKYLVPSVGL